MFNRWQLRLLVGIAALVGHAAALAAQTDEALFDDSAVQVIRIVMHDDDWATLKARYESNDYYPADLSWRGTVTRNVGVRSRGSATRNGIKPGLKVDMNQYVSGQTFLGLKSLVLDNAYSDPSLLHERISMKMLGRLGVPVPREAPASVWVNNEYVGAYAVVEPVDKTFLGRVYGERHGVLENGGYLYEYKWVMPWNFEYLGPTLEAYQPLFQPQTHEKESMAALYGPIEELVRTVDEASDATFRERVGALVDLPMLMTQLAAENFMAEFDGLVGNWSLNNVYLYRFTNSSLAQFIPWDKDSTFHGVDHPIDFNLDANVLVRRAMRVPELRQTYLDTLSAARDIADEPGSDDPRGWLEREIDRSASLMVATVEKDPGLPYGYDGFLSEVQSLIEFARARGTYVACQIGNAERPDGSRDDCAATLAASSSASRWSPRTTSSGKVDRRQIDLPTKRGYSR
ncbi:MAG: CotH kinase family protein [Vicinamibacterales bacterium]